MHMPVQGMSSGAEVAAFQRCPLIEVSLYIYTHICSHVLYVEVCVVGGSMQALLN